MTFHASLMRELRGRISKTAFAIGWSLYLPSIQKERWYAFQGAR